MSKKPLWWTDLVLSIKPSIKELRWGIADAVICVRWHGEYINNNYYYRPQTKFAKVMFLQVSVILSTGGACMVAWGGMVACVVAPGGACVVTPRGVGGMRGCSRGACVVALGGCAWLLPGGGVCVVAWDTMRYGDTINERAVRILLECILVIKLICIWMLLPRDFLWKVWRKNCPRGQIPK